MALGTLVGGWATLLTASNGAECQAGQNAQDSSVHHDVSLRSATTLTRGRLPRSPTSIPPYSHPKRALAISPEQRRRVFRPTGRISENTSRPHRTYSLTVSAVTNDGRLPRRYSGRHDPGARGALGQQTPLIKGFRRSSFLARIASGRDFQPTPRYSDRPTASWTCAPRGGRKV